MNIITSTGYCGGTVREAEFRKAIEAAGMTWLDRYDKFVTRPYTTLTGTCVLNSAFSGWVVSVKSKPNWWWRLWVWVLLGWKWKVE